MGDILFQVVINICQLKGHIRKLTKIDKLYLLNASVIIIAKCHQLCNYKIEEETLEKKCRITRMEVFYISSILILTGGREIKVSILEEF